MRRALFGRGPLVVLGALLAAYLLGPILAFAVRLGEHGATAGPGLLPALGTSALSASISTAVIAVLGVPLAYLLARRPGHASTAISVLIALPLALPPLISGVLLIDVVGPYSSIGGFFDGALTDSLAGIVLAQTFVAAPFTVVAARAAFASLDPALDDVAATLGHGKLARFGKVALPAAAGGIAAGLLLSWLRAFGEFGATVILAYHPYSLPVYTFVRFSGTGLAGTVAPVGAGLAAAILVLALTHIGAHPRRRATRLPAPRPPAPRPAGPLSFTLRRRLGEFTLELCHAGRTRQVALLGPSGAGKTLALRLLDGLEHPDASTVRAGSQEWTDVAAERRDVGYVPQHAGLQPRRTVWAQLTFGVGADPALAAWWLHRLGLHGLQERYPHELSGGQARRVALARALARNPALLLLDEPFAGLDAPVAGRLRRDLRRLQQETDLATVLVTHDAGEAAQLSAEMLVLAGGRLLQAGRTADVLAHPGCGQVATLLGIPNHLPGRVTGPGYVAAGGLRVAASTGALAPGTPVGWAIRPEHIRLDTEGPYPATVVDAVEYGGTRELILRLGDDLELVARTPATGPRLATGPSCRVDLPAAAITLWAEHGGEPPARRAGTRRAAV